MLVYLISTVIIVIHNKFIMSHLNWNKPFFLSTLHLLVSSLTSLAIVGGVKFRKLNFKIIMLAFVTSANLVACQWSLWYCNSIYIHQILRTLSPVTTALIQGDKFDYFHILLIVGAVTTVWGGISIFAFSAAIFSVFFTSCKSILMQKVCVGENPVLLMSLVMPASTLMSLALSVYFEGIPPSPLNIPYKHLIVNSLIAALVNYSSLKLSQKLSPIRVSALANCKTMFLITISLVMNRMMDIRRFISISLTTTASFQLLIKKRRTHKQSHLL